MSQFYISMLKILGNLEDKSFEENREVYKIFPKQISFNKCNVFSLIPN